MIAQLPLYSQRSSLWFDAKMIPSPWSLGQQGCTLTAACSMAKAFGKDINPLTANKEMVRLGGYDNTGSLSWLVLAKVLGIDFGTRWDTNANVAPNHSQVVEMDGFRHIERLAKWGIPSICWVDTDHDGKANHWVTYVGDGQVIDPWDGAVKPMSVFERLYGYAIFNGTPVYAEDGKVAAMIGKANEVAHGRNVALNSKEIMDTVNRP